VAEPNSGRRGSLKLYLGYAAGVGKTFQMLADGHAAHERGADVAIGYFEPHARPDTIAQAETLGHVPRRKVEYRGRAFEDMDTQAILERHPEIVLVDELAHTNVPGSERNKRWEDVQALLDAGIEVWATMNVQHIESLNDQVWQITGIRVRETVPDWIIKQAGEIVAIDVTPEALLNRLKRGAVYGPQMAQKALEGFFRESNLGALREMTLRQAAHEVDARQAAYDETTAPPDTIPNIGNEKVPELARERILVHVTADPSAAMLIRRGRRVADYLQGECVVVYVHRTPVFADVPTDERAKVEKHLAFARNLRIQTEVIQGRDISETVVEFAHRHQVTQIFVARSHRHLWDGLRRGNYVEEIVRLAHDFQVTVVADRSRRQVS